MEILTAALKQKSQDLSSSPLPESGPVTYSQSVSHDNAPDPLTSDRLPALTNTSGSSNITPNAFSPPSSSASFLPSASQYSSSFGTKDNAYRVTLPMIPSVVSERMKYGSFSDRVTKKSPSISTLKSTATEKSDSVANSINTYQQPYQNPASDTSSSVSDVDSPVLKTAYGGPGNLTKTINSILKPTEIGVNKNASLPSISSISSHLNNNDIYNTGKNTADNTTKGQQCNPLSDLPSYGQYPLQNKIPDTSSRPSTAASSSSTKPASGSHTYSTYEGGPSCGSPSEQQSQFFDHPRNTEFNIKETRVKLIAQWQLISSNDEIRVGAIKSAPRSRSPTKSDDIVSQGVISLKEAEYRLHIYKTTLYKNYPLVYLPDDANVEHMRTKMPLLFLTVMAVSSMFIPIEKANELAKEHEATKNQNASGNIENHSSDDQKTKFKRAFDTALIINNQSIDSVMYDVMILGNKTLELLKCLVLINMWYNTPEMYHHQKAHLITHMCTTMAFDLGLGGYTVGAAASGLPTQQNTDSSKNGFSKSDFFASNETSIKNPRKNSLANQNDQGANINDNNINNNGNSINNSNKEIKYDRILRPYMLHDPHSYRCRKLWLCVYICSISVSLVIKRPVYMMWSRYTEECCEMLEKPDRPDNERRVAVIARLNHILEQLSSSLQTNDPSQPPDVNDPRTQSLLKYFESQLCKISNVGFQSQSRIFITNFHTTRLFLYESALYIPYSPFLGRSPYTEYSLALGVLNITIPVVQAIGNCYYASTSIIETFLAQTIPELACTPMFTYSRMVMAVSILLKLRTLYLTVPEIRAVCTVTKEEIKRIGILLEMLDEVNKTYAFSNCALNYSLVLRILIYHYDRQLHFYNEHRRETEIRNQQETTAAADEEGKLDGKAFGKKVIDESQVFSRSHDLFEPPTMNNKSMYKPSVAIQNIPVCNNDNGNTIGGNGGESDSNETNILPHIAEPTTSFNKRSEAERDVILFMQKQQNGKLAGGVDSSNETVDRNNSIGYGRGITANPKTMLSPLSGPLTTDPDPSGTLESQTGTVFLQPPLQPSTSIPSSRRTSSFFSASYAALFDSNGRLSTNNTTPNSSNWGLGSHSNSISAPVLTENSTAATSANMNSINQLGRMGNVENEQISGSFGSIPGSLENNPLGLPSWLFVEDSWKELASEAEALSGFDLLG